jgi:hypothetical protein
MDDMHELVVKKLAKAETAEEIFGVRDAADRRCLRTPT